ncbi:hypothetical protein R3P38DRAFT_3463825 [Favolaschia claudopus]|uniref:Uncharacterized protein n=1 Tax=Favolaschia claudopus TaxID=2862362 RepID=A0AAV9ZHE0_9AGAR
MLWSSPSIYSQPEQTEEQELSEYPFQVPGYEGEMWLHRGTDPWSAYSARFQAIIAQHVNDSPNVGVNTHPMSLCSGFSDPGLPATWKRLDSHFLADADLTAECPMHIHPLPSLLNTPDSIRYPKSKTPTRTVLHPVRTSLDDSLLHIHPLQLEMHSQKTLFLPPLSVQRSTATSAVKTRSSVDLDTSSGQWPTPTATMGMEQLFAKPASNVHGMFSIHGANIQSGERIAHTLLRYLSVGAGIMCSLAYNVGKRCKNKVGEDKKKLGVENKKFGSKLENLGPSDRTTYGAGVGSGVGWASAKLGPNCFLEVTA